jgi:competence protein ComEC
MSVANLFRIHWTKSIIFVLLSVSFAIGILLESIIDINTTALGVVSACLIASFGILYSSKKSPAALTIALMAIAAVFGSFRMQAAFEQNQFETLFDRRHELEGVIVSGIDLRTDKQLFEFQPDGFDQKILITTTLYAAYEYGDRMVVIDKIERAKNFDDFDYEKFLEKDGVYAVMRYPKILPLEPGQGNWLIEKILSLKSYLVSRLERIMPEPERSLLLGILIGAKKTLPDSIIEDFNRTGTSHIVAVSGYNISIIIVALASLAKFFGRRASFWLSMLFIVIYVIMSGASSSVLRAAIMGVLLLTSLTSGRLYRIIPALMFAALCMLLINPKILYYDVGFQLSFLATLGIVLFVPLLESYTKKIPNVGQLKPMVLATISAIIATTPLILLQFERFSVIAPVVNILILPIVPLTMLFGFLSVIPYFSYGFGLVSLGLLRYMLRVTELFSRLSFSSLEFHISTLSFLSLYLSIAMVYVLLRVYQTRSTLNRSDAVAFR